jgi:uncharacterized protein YegP (UPF0339 family)
MYKFQYYKDVGDEWRWKIKHQNGNILAISSEGYKNKQDMFDVIFNLLEALSGFGEDKWSLLEEINMSH